MASYTMQLRDYVEMFSQDTTIPTRERIEFGRKKLFDFEYPLFNEAYRKVFETNFIRKFYMREIGFETEELFKFQMETWLLINMPYFNRMFESELIEYDPLINSRVDVTHNKQSDKTQNENRVVDQTSSMDGTNNSVSGQVSDGTKNTTQNSTGELIDDNFDRQLESDNPDSRLALTATDGTGVIQYAKTIKENNENNVKNSTSDTVGDTTTHNVDSATNDATSKVKSIANQKDGLSSNINDVEDFIQHRVGKIGIQSQSKLIEDYRKSLLRIEKTIFDEMNELFMLVY